MKAINRLADSADRLLCRLKLLPTARWEPVRTGRVTRLYAGRLSRGAPQYRTHFGLTPFAASTRNIPHDVTRPMPIDPNSIDIYQAEDVFEHLPYEELDAALAEIYRVLRPGGLFRLSVPDYRSKLYRDRCIKNDAGELVFDPGGGGRFEGGRVVAGGHLWFPTIESVKNLFDRSPFAQGGSVNFRHFTRPDGTPVLERIDYSLGYIQRTPDNDLRAQNPPRPLSIVVDAYK